MMPRPSEIHSPDTAPRPSNSGTAIRAVLLALVVWLSVIAPGLAADGAAVAEEKDKAAREIFVPFDDLHVLLENQPQRVLLSRAEYLELLKKAKLSPETHAPLPAVLLSADYTATVEHQRARLSGKLAVDVLEDGLHAVPLDISGVGLQRATLDGHNAPIGRADDGRLTLLVEGIGRHELLLEMVTPLETAAARQSLQLRLPRPAAATLRLTVPGDVEVKSGSDVVQRVVDEAAGVTRFELLPSQGDTTLVMSLNSHLKRTKEAVVARSVLVDEVTEAYEKLHATVSLAVLHRAVDHFRFVVPEGFEITEINSPLMARWNVEKQDGRALLTVQLREQTTDTVVLNLSAIKTPGPSKAWAFPKLEPLDVVGEVAVVGLLVQQRLKAEAIAQQGLIPIDTAVLSQALPETIAHAAPGTPPLRPVVAYYAPQSQFQLTAGFDKPPARLSVRSNLLLILDDKGQEVRGGLAMMPEVEKLFQFEFTVPAHWHVTSVIGANETPLTFERYGAVDQPSRIRVRLPEGVAPGQQYTVNFQAVSSPAGWLGDWPSFPVEFPAFVVAGADDNVGAVAVEARDDMTVRPDSLRQLTPLDETEKAQYALANVATNLAYRYESPDYAATLRVQRTQPRLTARTFSFVEIKPEGLTVRYEVTYNVEEARTRRLVLLLGKETPAALSIRGLGGLKLKEYNSELVDEGRRWTVLLEEAQRGVLRLGVQFDLPLPEPKEKGKPVSLMLPIVQAGDVAYQSGLVAVEGSAELNIAVSSPDARRVDVGELVDAEYQPGRRLLGVLSFVGDTAKVKADVSRDEAYRLKPAIVQQAELHTYLSAEGTSQTQAEFRLHTEAQYLEVRLPDGSELWSALVDGKPVKPQCEAMPPAGDKPSSSQGKRLLVGLPAAAAGAHRDLKLVYETKVRAVSLRGAVRVPAPALFLRSRQDSLSAEVPLADLVWRLHLPQGYEVVRTGGTVVPIDADRIQKPAPALVEVAGALYLLAGGVHPLYGSLSAARESARVSETMNYLRQSRSEARSSAREPAGAEGERSFYMADSVRLSEQPPATTAVPAEMPAHEALPPPAAEPAQTESVPAKDALAKTPEQLQSTLVPAPPAANAPAPPPADMPAQPPATPAPEVKPEPAKRARGDRQTGLRSLQIDLAADTAPTGPTITFRSLGAGPALDVTLVDGSRRGMLAWGLTLAVLLAGLALTGRPAAMKIRFLVSVALLSTLVVLAVDSVEIARTCNMLFYAATFLAAYYVAVALVRWIGRYLVRAVRRVVSATRLRTATAATVLVLACATNGAAVRTAQAADPAAKPGDQAGSGPYVIQVVEPSAPVEVPEDAVILPYDPQSTFGLKDVDKLLMPYAKYVELWNRAYPDKKIEQRKTPAAYALAGAAYSSRLAGDEYLLITGRVEIDVYDAGHVTVPLGLAGGVLARADLDGKPARLSVAQAAENAGAAGAQQAQMPAQQPAQQVVQQPAQQAAAANQAAVPGTPQNGSLILLYVSGKGRHTLELAVRVRLTREGGWRVAEALLPTAPAAAFAMTVPDAKTELRLGQVADCRSYETEAADEKIESVLGPGGAMSVRWRPKVAEGQVDRSLTARSVAVLDVQEDGLRLVWQLQLEFRRSQREQFRIDVPTDYLVEKVEGPNVRGWELRDEAGRSQVDVILLKAAKDAEQFTVHLWRRGAVGQGDLAEFAVPAVSVADAALQNGELTVRRSPLLELRTLDHAGTSRTDISDQAAKLAGGPDSEESPLHIRPYEAYRFMTVPFSLRLAAAPVAARVAATVQHVLKIGEYERTLESRVTLQVQGRPLYKVEMFVPEGLKLKEVSAPGEFQWALTTENGRRLLSVYLASAAQGEVAVLIRGTLGTPGKIAELPLPQFEVRGVDRQQGDMAVEIDPGFRVDAQDLVHCDKVLLQQLGGWLTPGQLRVTQLALHYRSPDYGGTLRFSPREPVVTCTTITNARVTDRAIEETVLLNFNIQQAGIRELSFVLPAWMRDARISVPSLRQKTVEPLAKQEGSPVRVRIELQDEVMGELCVLAENDRLLRPNQDEFAAIPSVETGRTDRRLVSLESAGRDEVVVGPLKGLSAIGRQQKEWQTLKDILGTGITQAYLVDPDAQEPQFSFKTADRQAVETAGARIGLAETRLWLDANGAYRAWVTYRMDNTTEQFLAVQLPPGAELWTAWVAGEPVKPAIVPGATGSGQVRIPLVKTAAGDLDYAVVLCYGGKMPAMGAGGKVEFPLASTENIHVEMSQVRLSLPRTYKWFDFGGTMNLVPEEADLAAGYLAYQTKVAERLVQTVRHDNPFAQVRAANNLKQIGLGFSNNQSSLSSYASNQGFRTELANNSQVLQEAQREIENIEAAPSQTQARDNRDALKDRYAGQKTARSRNVVQDVGGNWTDFDLEGKSSGGKAASTTFFNGRWLDKNMLDNAAVLKEGPTSGPAQAGEKPAAGKPAVVWEGKKSSSTLARQPATPELAQGKAKAELAESFSRQMTVDEQTRQGEDSSGQVLRYQKRLQQQAESQPQVQQQDQMMDGVSGFANGLSGRGTIAAGSGSATGERLHGLQAPAVLSADGQLPAVQEDFGLAQGQVGGMGGVMGGGMGGMGGGRDGQAIAGLGTAVPAGVTGLASVELQPPTDTEPYQVFCFTVPRGKTEITARTFSRNLLGNLAYLAAVAAIVLAVAYLVWLARRGRFAWLQAPGGSTALILLGLVSLLFGILPVAGLAAAAAGIVLKIRRAMVRPHAAVR